MILKISYLTYLLPFIGATIGMVSVYFLRLKKSIAFKLILAFSGAFILGITINHLIPKVFSQNFFMAGPWVISGILFQILLEFVSQGAEHGHTHLKENSELPWLLLISFPLFQLLCLRGYFGQKSQCLRKKRLKNNIFS